MDQAELMRAYNAARRNNWPPLEEAMKDPLYSRLIRSAAWRLANKPTYSEPAPAPQPVTLRPMPAFDRKRLAAGDKDDK